MESVTVISGPAAVAVPLTVIVAGLVASLLGTSKVSVNDPIAVGANLTIKKQLAAGAIVMPEHQSLPPTRENGALRGLLTAIEPMIRFVVPEFLIVIVWSDVAVATTLPKSTIWSDTLPVISVILACGPEAAKLEA